VDLRILGGILDVEIVKEEPAKDAIGNIGMYQRSRTLIDARDGDIAPPVIAAISITLCVLSVQEQITTDRLVSCYPVEKDKNNFFMWMLSPPSTVMYLRSRPKSKFIAVSFTKMT
jgi:hypothetical protein